MTRKSTLAVACLVVLVGLSFAVGLVAQRRYQVLVIEKVVSTVVGGETPPPPLDKWAYPNAERRYRGSSGGVSTVHGPIIHNPHIGIWTTPDSFDKVIEYYAMTLGFDAPLDVASRAQEIKAIHRGNLGGEDPSSRALIRDNVMPEKDAFPLPLRSARMEGFVKRTRTYHVTGFLSRTDDEQLTHIVIVYDPLIDTDDD